MRRLVALVALGAVFLREVISGGVTTAWLILRRSPATPALVRLPYSGLSPNGAAMLACLVTLTPGTSTVDLDLESQCLLLHLLDGHDPHGTVDGIRRRFEQPLRTIFPGGRP